MLARPLLVIAGIAISITVPAKPSVLIVQRLAKDKEAHNIPVGQKLAEQLDLEGRVAPILWSMTDPIFRVYIEEKKLPGYVSNPDDRVVRDYASRLKVAYVLIVEAVATNDVVRPQATLYDGLMHRTLWSMIRDEKRGVPRLVVSKDGKIDEEATKTLREKYAEILSDGTLATMTVLINGQPNWDNTAESLARTWTQLLAEGPLKTHEPQRRIFAPEPGPALTFKGPPIQQAAPSLAIDDAMVRAQTLVKENRSESALLVLRDAVDAAPFDLRPRLELIELLISQGLYELAANEAERAVPFTENQGVVWARAADAWIQAGDTEKALLCANQSVARGLVDFGVLQVLAEVWLQKGDIEKALKFYDQAMEQESSQRAYLGRSIAKAISGDKEGSLRDLMAAQDTNLVPLVLYQRTMSLIARTIAPTAESLRKIPQFYRVGKTEVAEVEAVRIQQSLSALVELLVRFKVPEKHKQSHSTRDLAYKLLKQSSVDALAFAKYGNEDSALESAISLGEALKLIPQIEEQFRVERKYTLASRTN